MVGEQDRQANARAHADMEFLAREVASLRMAVGEVATRDFLRSELRSLREDLVDDDEGGACGVGMTATGNYLDWRHEHSFARPAERRPRHRPRPRDQASDHRRSAWSSPVEVDDAGLVQLTVLLTVAGLSDEGHHRPRRTACR